MNKLRVGVIGLGGWGVCHLEAYQAIPNVEIVAICDNRESVLADIGGRFHIEHRYTESELLMERDDIDLVSVVTSEVDRLRIVLQVLNAGKHALVEKPVSFQASEAQLMLEAAKQNGRYVIPGHILRFEPRYVEIHDMIRNGSLGAVQSMYFKRARTKEMFQMYSRTHSAYISGAHDIDLAIWYTGSRVKSVRAYGKWVTGKDNPDIVWGCLEFHNGAIAFVHSNWMTPDEAGLTMNDSIEVIGSKGNAQFDNRGTGLELWDSEGRHTPDLNIHRLRNGHAQGALREQLEYISRCILEGSEPAHTSFPDAIHGIEVAEAIVRSAAEGKEIVLPIAQD